MSTAPSDADDYRLPARPRGLVNNPTTRSSRWPRIIMVGGALLWSGLTVASCLPDLEETQGSARRTTSRHGLMQIGFASVNFQDGHVHYPPWAVGESRTAGQTFRHPVSFFTAILPGLESNGYFVKIDFTRPWDDPANAAAFAEWVPVLMNPALPDAAAPGGYGPTHYVPNRHILSADGRGLRGNEVPDGLGNTILAGEIDGTAVPAWGDPTSARDPTLGLAGGPRRFGSPWAGGTNLLLMDGSVRFVSHTINPAVLRRLALPADGQAVGNF